MRAWVGALFPSLSLLCVACALEPPGEETTPKHLAGVQLMPGAWSWVPIEGSLSLDRSSSGIAVFQSPRSAPRGLMIFFEEGGACFDAISCAMTAFQRKDRFGEQEFQGQVTSTLNRGLLSDAAGKPFEGYHKVYIPYSSGDVHFGQHQDERAPQVGYLNMQRFLRAAQAAFAETRHIALVGTSAGGYGALAALPETRRLFPRSQIALLDISGPPLGPEVITPCLQRHWRKRWRIDRSLDEVCGPACDVERGGDLGQLWDVLLSGYPDVRFALLSSTKDEVIRFYLGVARHQVCLFEGWRWGEPAWAAERADETEEDEAYPRALAALRERLGQRANFATFFVESERHIVSDYSPSEASESAVPLPDEEGSEATSRPIVEAVRSGVESLARALSPRIYIFETLGLDRVAAQGVPAESWIRDFVQGRDAPHLGP